MKQVLFALLTICFVGVAHATPATVDYIIDGDTFAAMVKLEDGIRISVRVRIANIDTPEIHGACAYESEMALRAKERLSELIPIGADVDLRGIKDDKYLGRIDANVIMRDGRDAGGVMIADGLARAYAGGRRVPWCD